MTVAATDLDIILGYRCDGTPIRAVRGADDDPEPLIDDGDEPVDEVLDDQDIPNEEEEEPAEDLVPRSEIEALREAQRKRNEEHVATRDALRKRLLAAQAKLKEQARKARPVDPAADEEQRTKAIEEAVAAERATWQRTLINERASRALLRAGLHVPEDDTEDRRLKSALKMIDPEQIDFEDGAIVGLDEQIEELKLIYPELFQKPEPKKEKEPAPKIRAPRGDAAAKSATPPAPKTVGERIAAMVHGTGR